MARCLCLALALAGLLLCQLRGFIGPTSPLPAGRTASASASHAVPGASETSAAWETSASEPALRAFLAAGALGLALGVLSPSAAVADAIDDEVNEYINTMRGMILRQPEDDKPWKKKEEPDEGTKKFNLEYQRQNEEFVKQKYEKMKERVINARNEKERAKAMRAMKAEALTSAISLTESELLK
ncbi:unnamed protein product [Effrenium voratum]|nr:unnamed protein product [Effrenium voratum]